MLHSIQTKPEEGKMASSLLASQNLAVRRPIAAPSARLPYASLRFSSPHRHSLRIASSKPSISKISASISQTLNTSPIIKSPKSTNPNEISLLTGSTRTVTTLFAITLAAFKTLSSQFLNLTLQLKAPAISATGPAFFAAMKNVPAGSLNTPFTVVAAGMSKWLDLYSGVLMVRVLLSWFPNIPWDRQPLSAIRDLCDPYLNLFRNIIPPIFNTLDVSPLLAFAVLGTLGTILNNSRQAY